MVLDRLLSRFEAKHVLSVSLCKIDALVATGAIKPVRIGKRVLFSPASLQAFIAQGGKSR